ncbi:MAG TPA: HAMP domain-containing sensor histidine kinase [Acidimicrobiia bacterium]|nr:HAMP domain-containing sensor histidine kinase [Acidimicrobiia bacterium]
MDATDTPRTRTAGDLGNVAALLELCDAQQQVIDRLQKALAEHEEIESDRHMLKRMLAHELRTPLAAVIGALHTLALPNLPTDKAGEMRERALRQSMHLNEMIDDILELADPHEAAVDRTPQEWIDVADLVDDVIESVAPWLPADRLVVEVPPGVSVRTIPSRVRQILVNLVVNAAKYSPSDGIVTLTATRLDDSLVLEIVDEGPGIDPGAVEALFQPFARGKDVGGAEGVGLGLYLTRNLVRSLGGSVELIPRAHEGTLARVTLPQKRQEDALAPGTRRGHLRVVPSGETG